MVSYFVNNAAKTCLYGLTISEDIESEHIFQSKSPHKFPSASLTILKQTSQTCLSVLKFFWNYKKFSILPAISLN